MITYVTFNLFDSPAQTLVNTVNTVGVMGKGIALSFKQLYPDMYEEYRQLCKNRQFSIGMLHVYRTANKIILNFPTKKHWRQKSKVEYIEAGLDKFVKHYTDYGISSVSFPQLGCGNGELDWDTQVRPVMEQHLNRLAIPVYIHLYRQSPTFVPERIDPEYAREIQLERQRQSVNSVWLDLKTIVDYQHQLNLFGPRLTMDDAKICFNFLDGSSFLLHKEEIEDIWNILRLRGTVSVNDLSPTVIESGIQESLFDLLSKLDYISPIKLWQAKDHTTVDGLRHIPVPVKQPQVPVEVIV